MGENNRVKMVLVNAELRAQVKAKGLKLSRLVETAWISWSAKADGHSTYYDLYSGNGSRKVERKRTTVSLRPEISAAIDKVCEQYPKFCFSTWLNALVEEELKYLPEAIVIAEPEMVLSNDIEPPTPPVQKNAAA